MSDPVSPLQNAVYQGFARVSEIGPLGMISLRAKPDVKALAKAIKAAVGTAVPDQRRIIVDGDRAAGWMSPDEYLLILPYTETDPALATIAQAMSGAHHLAVTVSDARAMFRIEGDKADQVIAKLTPVDVATLPEGVLRRSRAAQVATAFWRHERGISLVCFRSVARYVFDLLAVSATPGSEISS